MTQSAPPFAEHIGLLGRWRGAARVLLPLQLVLALFGPLAEARLDTSFVPETHLEGQGAAACAPAHNHFLCVVGRTLGLQLPGAAALTPASPSVAFVVVAVAEELPHAVHVRSLHLARAPPLA